MDSSLSNTQFVENSSISHSSTNQCLSDSKVSGSRNKNANGNENKKCDRKRNTSYQESRVNKTTSSRQSNVAFAEEREYEPGILINFCFVFSDKILKISNGVLQMCYATVLCLSFEPWE